MFHYYEIFVYADNMMYGIVVKMNQDVNNSMNNKNNEDVKGYMESSKKAINHHLFHTNYMGAFCMFVMVIQRLEGNHRDEFIQYYSTNLEKFIMGRTPLENIQMQRLDYEL